MGGNLAWTIRQEDGTEHRMDHWTNSMPGLIQNRDFLNGDQAAIDATLAPWLAMKADWEANKATGNYQEPGTARFAPYPFGMKPSEYGMVVVDFQSKRILSLQGYSRLGKIFASRLSAGPAADEFDPSGSRRLFETAEQRRIREFEFIVTRQDAVAKLQALGGTAEPHPHDQNATVVMLPGECDFTELVSLCDDLIENGPAHPHASDIATFRDQASQMPADDPERAKIEATLLMMDIAHKHDNRPFLYANAHLDLAPFILEEFSSGSDGYRALLQRIEALGFKLSEAELEAWEKRIAEIERMDEEERASA